MSGLIRTLLRNWPLIAFLASAAMLATAHAFQTFGGLQPCTLCLRQREVYWAALPVAAAAFAADHSAWRARLRPLFAVLLALVFLTGVGIAVYHAGAEWKFWPGPSTCSSTGAGASAAAMARLLSGARFSAPRCDEAAWRLAGLSMAGWNALISLGLASLSAASAKERV